MSSPKEDVPEHVMIPVDVDGLGPTDADSTDHYECWCGTDCGTVAHITSDEGTKMCEDFAGLDIEPMSYADKSLAAGRCTVCAGYAGTLQRMIAEEGGQS